MKKLIVLLAAALMVATLACATFASVPVLLKRVEYNIQVVKDGGVSVWPRSFSVIGKSYRAVAVVSVNPLGQGSFTVPTFVTPIGITNEDTNASSFGYWSARFVKGETTIINLNHLKVVATIASTLSEEEREQQKIVERKHD